MLEDLRQVRLPSHADVEPDDRRTGGASTVVAVWRHPAGSPPTGFILEDSASPEARAVLGGFLASRTSTRLTLAVNATASVTTSSYAIWRRPSVPRTALGWVSSDAASPVNSLPRSTPATPGLASVAVLACAEVDITAAAISPARRTASGHVRRPDTRPSSSSVSRLRLAIQRPVVDESPCATAVAPALVTRTAPS